MLFLFCVFWAWGYLIWFLSTFNILHFVSFKFLLTLGNLRVFNFIFQFWAVWVLFIYLVWSLGVFGFDYEYSYFSVLVFWSLGVFYFLLVISRVFILFFLGGLNFWISFCELWRMFCFYKKKSRVFNFLLVILGVLKKKLVWRVQGVLLLWILTVLTFWSLGVFIFSSCHFVGF